MTPNSAVLRFAEEIAAKMVARLSGDAAAVGAPRRRKPRHHFRSDLLGERAEFALFGVKIRPSSVVFATTSLERRRASRERTARFFSFEPDQGPSAGNNDVTSVGSRT